VPGIYDPALADRDEQVSTEEAYELVRRLARHDGILVGPSGGAALAGCLRVMADGDIDHAVFVTIFPDRGDRYLSEGFWGDQGARVVAEALTVPDDVLGAIREHGARTYPDECCGALLGGESGAVVEPLALSNGMDQRRRRFLIDPDAYRAAEARAAETGLTLIGFYHSHPDHPAVPSAFDLEHAWPNLHYLIVSVREGRAEAARTWRLRADRSAFDEVSIRPVPPGRGGASVAAATASPSLR
jgi:proteasome lid subunit RPN8/RPN11